MGKLICDILSDESFLRKAPADIKNYAQPAFLTTESWGMLCDRESEVHRAVETFIHQKVSSLSRFSQQLASNAVPLSLFASQNDLNVLFANSSGVAGQNIIVHDLSSGTDSISFLFHRHHDAAR